MKRIIEWLTGGTQKADPLAQDMADYTYVSQRMSDLITHHGTAIIDTVEFQTLWATREKIKNKYDGMPPSNKG